MTNVNARTATSIERSKSGDCIKLTIFVEPKLQLISVPRTSYSCALLITEGLCTCKISEHKLLIMIFPSIGFALLTVSIFTIYG